MGYPSLKDESWRFTNISNIVSHQFHQSQREILNKEIASKYFINDCYHIVSVNGYLDLFGFLINYQNNFFNSQSIFFLL